MKINPEESIFQMGCRTRNLDKLIYHIEQIAPKNGMWMKPLKK